MNPTPLTDVLGIGMDAMAQDFLQTTLLAFARLSCQGRRACRGGPSNDGPTMVHAAVAGLGLVYMHEQVLQRHIERGELQVVLEEYAVSEAGLFLYFPCRAGLRPKLRTFINIARQELRPSVK